ncbi:MAG: DsrE family protein [Thiobacillus sp.]|nr:DsrE family protein [Thiobacillus sp.]
MFKYSRSICIAASSFLLMTTATPSLSAEPAGPEKYVMQISDMDPDKQERILNVARNVLDAYPPGEAEVEIVAFGPGLRLLFENNVNAKRIDSLAQSGVKFSACGNTIKGMTKLMGEAPKLNPVATVVPAGVVRIGQLSKQDYIYIKP